MMDWTDRHCRAFHRTMSRRTLLYTEMVTAPALVRGGARHLLDFGEAEHPVAVQLGGSDPAELAQAARMAGDAGYDEVNLNVGCPSDRVQSGCFGAVLMERPGRVWSRGQLLDRVWGQDMEIDYRTVDVHVGRLRKALRQEGEADPIRTVRAAGYSLDYEG